MKILNKKAYYEYHILEEYDAGIKLIGSEVKSLALGNANINDAFVFLTNSGEAFVKNLYIDKYHEASITNHEERADRKLLLTKKQLNKIAKELKVTGITIIPLDIHLYNGKFKMKIGIAQGKKNWDKRNAKKEKDIKRETQQTLANRF